MVWYFLYTALWTSLVIGLAAADVVFLGPAGWVSRLCECAGISHTWAVIIATPVVGIVGAIKLRMYELKLEAKELAVLESVTTPFIGCE